MRMKQIASRYFGSMAVGALVLASLGIVSPWPVSIEGAAPNFKINNEPIDRSTRANSFAPIVEKASKSVVNISSTKKMERSPLMEKFRRFFGDQFGDIPEQRKRSSLGSGVIVTKDGYILTNNHVVQNADEIEVTLAEEEKQYTAEVVGGDPATDLAVIKIDASNLPAITITDSDQVKKGDLVLAIGNPFGLGQTATMGMVSAIGRGFRQRIAAYENFIQTDAAINPGNSGGALVDIKGRLIGINTFILSQSGGSQGVGFSVPIDMARNVMKQIIEHGEVKRGYLGVFPQDLEPEHVKYYGLESQEGALVSRVVPDTPAAKAGLKEEDVIIKFNGKPVEDSRHLRLLVAQTPPTSEATVTVIRDEAQKKLTVDLTRRPDNIAQMQRQRQGGGDQESKVLTGVAVTDITRQWREQFNIPSDIEGALVRDVEADSPAREAGLRPGDVILTINREKVGSAEEAMKLTQQIEGDRVLLRVWSRGAYKILVVNAGRNG